MRGGALLPLGPEMNYVGEKPVSVLTLDLYPDNDGAAAAQQYPQGGARRVDAQPRATHPGGAARVLQ